MSKSIKNVLPKPPQDPLFFLTNNSPLLGNRYRDGVMKTEESNKSSWNVGESPIADYSHRNDNSSKFLDYSSLVYENERLKAELKVLQKLLAGDSKIQGERKDQNYYRSGFTSPLKKENNAEEISKLKGLIEKSYYSIRQMEIQVEELTEKLHRSERENSNLQSKLKIAEFQKEEATRKFFSLTSVHKEEIDLFNDRIYKLEDKIGQLVGLIEQDHQDWRVHMKELNNFKKFYLQGTYR